MWTGTLGDTFIGSVAGTLVDVALNNNLLNGHIPSSIGGCLRLHRLNMHYNSLSGIELLASVTPFVSLHDL